MESQRIDVSSVKEIHALRLTKAGYRISPSLVGLPIEIRPRRMVMALVPLVVGLLAWLALPATPAGAAHEVVQAPPAPAVSATPDPAPVITADPTPTPRPAAVPAAHHAPAAIPHTPGTGLAPGAVRALSLGGGIGSAGLIGAQRHPPAPRIPAASQVGRVVTLLFVRKLRGACVSVKGRRSGGRA